MKVEGGFIKCALIRINKEIVFEQEVLKIRETGTGRFYADWCGPCQMLSPIVDGIG